MTPAPLPLWLAGRPQSTEVLLTVHDKFTGEPAVEMCRGDAGLLDEAIAAAEEAARPLASLPAHARSAALRHVAERLTERAEELARALVAEVGKPIVFSRGEVARAIDTFTIASEEALRRGGEVLPMDRTPRGEGYTGFTKRVPVGPCAFITPFNFPLNLAAHKVAPALAVGCPFVLKPSSVTPWTAILLGEILAECDLPEGTFSILPLASDDAGPLVEDDRLKHLSFTGSPDVGWGLKAKARRKTVTLELGGNAAAVVDRDWDLRDAVDRIVFGAFYQAGQSCISVQRVYVHEEVHPEFNDALLTAVRGLKVGDPYDDETFVGPLIRESDAERVEQWIDDAVRRGGRVLCGGTREGATVAATVVENVPEDAPLCAREAFGPVLTLAPFADFDEALDRVDRSEYGLQAGVFTRDLHRALRAWDRLEVGGVIIGDIPSWRADHMPYGGSKKSGLGREGLRWAMDEMSELRLMVVRQP